LCDIIIIAPNGANLKYNNKNLAQSCSTIGWVVRQNSKDTRGYYVVGHLLDH